MGESLTMRRAWGFVVDTYEEDIPANFDEIYKRKKGLVSPFTNGGDYPDPLPDNWDELCEVHFAESQKIMEECPVESYSAYHYDSDREFFYIKESYVVDYNGVIDIEEGTPETNPEWEGQLREYCEFLGIPFLEPRWLIVGTWG